MNISAWAIKNPIPIFLLFVLLTVMGMGTFRGLGINQWPDVDFPMIVVTVTRPGASPTELETDITRKVEDAVVGVKGLDHIRSTVVEGTSTTIVEFKVGSDTETALNEVRDAVSRIRTASSSLDRQLEAVADQGNAVVRELSAGLGRLNFQTDLGVFLDSAMDRLQQAIGPRDVAYDRVDRDVLEPIMASLSAAYTMAQERQVHRDV
ncbi:MAG: efflux RND transporter permease subunit, partial [Candidatus Sericytochromatia bacterium]